jgi:hypothetical protein
MFFYGGEEFSRGHSWGKLPPFLWLAVEKDKEIVEALLGAGWRSSTPRCCIPAGRAERRNGLSKKSRRRRLIVTAESFFPTVLWSDRAKMLPWHLLILWRPSWISSSFPASLVRLRSLLGFHRNRVAGFPRRTRKSLRMPSQGVSPISLDRQLPVRSPIVKFSPENGSRRIVFQR